MTDEMRAFMREMAEVMERHNVTEMIIVEESHGWDTVTTGIEFTRDFDTGEGWNDMEMHTVHTWMTAEDFREEADRD